MAQPSSVHDHQNAHINPADHLPMALPIIGTLTGDGVPIISGIVHSIPNDPMVESTFTFGDEEEGEEDMDMPISEQSAEMADIIDIEVEEEMTLRVFRGAGGGLDIETIAEEEEPVEEEEEGMKMMDEDDEPDEREEEVKLRKEGEEQQQQPPEIVVTTVVREGDTVPPDVEEMKPEGGGMKEEEVEVRIDLEKKAENGMEVEGGLTERQQLPAEVVITVARQTVHRTSPSAEDDGRRMDTLDDRKKREDEMSGMKTEEIPTTKIMTNSNNHAHQPSISGVESTIIEIRREVGTTDEPMIVIGDSPSMIRQDDQEFGALHVQKRVGEEDPWKMRENGGGGGRTRMMMKRNGSREKEDRRMLAEGEAMLRELMADHGGREEPKMETTTTTTTTTTRREVVIEQVGEQPRRKWQENGSKVPTGEGTVVQVVMRQKSQEGQQQVGAVQAQQRLSFGSITQRQHVEGVQKQQQQQVGGVQEWQQDGAVQQQRQQQDGAVHQLERRSPYSPPLSPTTTTLNNNNNQQSSPLQNGGGGSAACTARSPGPHSPFGQLEPPTEEEWRLSPKTLSRIKLRKVVMEANGTTDGAEVIHHHPIFVRDTSRYWYKPTISREDAIAMLKNKPPGTFIVRDSNSFPGAFGLALKVAQPPPGVLSSADGSELVRHFLIEPSPKGVRLKGCSNEPVFGTLSALVYQHSITPLALPCRLILPDHDPASTPEHLNSNQALLERGAACNVTYLCSVDTESLTGPEALRRSISYSFDLLQKRELRAVPVHFKVSAQGITLTDNTRSLFFRRHYPVNTVTFAGIDPESRVFDNNNVAQLPPTYVRQAPVFGFVARKCAGFGDLTNGGGVNVENACHLFAELDPDQPASAVVRFITNVMMPASRAQQQQQLQIHHQSANNVR